MRNRSSIFNFAILVLALIFAYDAFSASQPLQTNSCESALNAIVVMDGTFDIENDQLKLKFPNEMILGVYSNSLGEVLIVTRDYAPENYIGRQTENSQVRNRVNFRVGRVVAGETLEKLNRMTSAQVQSESYKLNSSTLGSVVMETLSRKGLSLQYVGRQPARLFALDSQETKKAVLTLEYSQIGNVSDDLVETIVKHFLANN